MFDNLSNKVKKHDENVDHSSFWRLKKYIDHLLLQSLYEDRYNRSQVFDGYTYTNIHVLSISYSYRKIIIPSVCCYRFLNKIVILPPLHYRYNFLSHKSLWYRGREYLSLYKSKSESHIFTGFIILHLRQ